ncbi:alanine racemase [Martelella radicis]|uniref:D-serine deaminase-like pyridoxal phosphate-dependent protein n=1 Tax=Martelella radicis TaxID=1397476 RepID=A0A7W6KJQ6_9HYPH|nr:alanine racemase [Martelella radicis]MBB4122598.1 D-serine deaminase-like pyridoxal phosphate-dependent protein [Martelella radicis]
MTDTNRTPARPAFEGADQLETPCVVVDAARLQTNIEEMQAVASAGKVALHPHIKTHKSLAIADRQRRAGARGITASHPGEAAVFVRAGFSPVTLAYPLVRPEPVTALLALGREHDVKLRFIVDSLAGVEALEAGAKKTGETPDVFIKVDVGLHRCGVDPATDEGIALAGRLMSSSLCFAGLLSHAGQAYGAGTPDGVRKVAAGERHLLLNLRQRLEARGYPVPLISVGSTPSLIANDGFDGIDEVRPGNYAFYDMTAVRLGIVGRERISLAVAATIISRNRDFYIIDAGSKTLSSDLGPHSTGPVSGFGEAWNKRLEQPLAIAKLSEEHGMVARQGSDLEIGERLLIYPNHACVVVNLAASLTLIDAGKTSRLSIDATRRPPVSA